MASNRNPEPRLGLGVDEALPSDNGRLVLTPAKRELARTLLAGRWLRHPATRELTEKQYVDCLLHATWLVNDSVISLIAEQLADERRPYEPSLRGLKDMARAAIEIEEELRAIRPRRRVPRPSKDAMRPRASDRQG